MVLAPGATMPALDVAPGVKGVLGGQLTAKYGFVCLGHDLWEYIPELYPGLNLTAFPKTWRLCNQGMNEAGLAVSWQANLDNTTLNLYNTSDSRPAVNFWDLPNSVLASYATVAEVKEAYGKYQIVYSPEYFADYEPEDPPAWLAIYDASGAAAVIQFRQGAGEVVDNPVGVVGNDPGFMDDHLQQYLAHVQSKGFTIDATTKLINGPIVNKPGGVSFLGDPDVAFKDPNVIPGGYDGNVRYIRMAMLKGIATLQKCGPDPEISTTSYMALEKGYPSSLPSLMVVEQILRTVTLTQGMTDFGSAVL
ncbi:MAG: nucleophile aminohydrolase [Monoraphidium minutum]|nr:MAG: nucleophile aminohydrolase [Monoraphidium minutum]